jgi:hypothetical protein
MVLMSGSEAQRCHALSHGFGSLSLEGRFRVVDDFGVLFGKSRDLVFNVGSDGVDSANHTIQVGLEGFRVVVLDVDWLGPVSPADEPLGRANRVEEL